LLGHIPAFWNAAAVFWMRTRPLAHSRQTARSKTYTSQEQQIISRSAQTEATASHHHQAWNAGSAFLPKLPSPQKRNIRGTSAISGSSKDESQLGKLKAQTKEYKKVVIGKYNCETART
jgi:hypothetical protein